MRLPTLRSLAPPLAAALVAIAGGAVLWAGLSRTAALGGDAPLTGDLPAVTQPVVVTVPGMSELAGGEFTVRASAPGGRPVFVGVGRTDDVEAYLGGVARAEVTALEPGGTLRVSGRPGEPSLPDPSGVDVWAAAARGQGTATLSWPRAPGSWRVVVAVDGATAPSGARFTWAGSAGASPAPALIAVGAVLLVAGLAGLLAIRSGRVFARAGQVDRPDRPDGPDRQGGPDRPGRRAEGRSGRRADHRSAEPAAGRTLDRGVGPTDDREDRPESPRRAAAAARGERSAVRRSTRPVRSDPPTAPVPVATPAASTPEPGPTPEPWPHPRPDLGRPTPSGWTPDVDLRETPAQAARRRAVEVRRRSVPPAGSAADEDGDDEAVAIQPFRRGRPPGEDQ